MTTTTAPSAPVATAAPSLDPKRRVSLYVRFHEVWQGTLQQFCRAYVPEKRPTLEAVAAAIDAKAGPCGVGAVVNTADIVGRLNRRLPEMFTTEGELKWTHTYQDQKTGSLYTDGHELPSIQHWDRHGPIRATLGQTQERKPLVTIDTGFGMGGDYTPQQIRDYALALERIATDAEAQPMGPRNFHRSIRGYRV